ncbi:MAG: alpha/beta hydrolase [Pirellulales bacterium]|nr:alpha/beta hydrolase [Pirellulales bacterium]
MSAKRASEVQRGASGTACLRCVVLGAGIALGCTAAAEGPARLDRYKLLRYRDAGGEVRPVKTPADWQQRRAEIVRGMQEAMGNLPGPERRVSLDVKVQEEADAGTYVRRLITYQSEPQSRTPAYLCIPKDVLAGRRRAPAVLCLHPTDNQVGHQVVVGLGGRPGRQYAAELAERGYVTLSPSYPHLADYWPNLARLGYVSGTMKAVWDNSRGLDLLASLPYVDSSRGFGAIGHSLGGHNAIYTAVFDPRITVLASSCGFDSFLQYYDGSESNWYFGKGWCQIRYMPRLSNYRGRLEEIPFDFPELLGALAPRRCFVNAPQYDDNFQCQSVAECAAAAYPVYELLGGKGHLCVEHPDCGHDFPGELRAAAYRAIDAVLRPGAK